MALPDFSGWTRVRAWERLPVQPATHQMGVHQGLLWELRAVQVAAFRLSDRVAPPLQSLTPAELRAVAFALLWRSIRATREQATSALRCALHRLGTRIHRSRP